MARPKFSIGDLKKHYQERASTFEASALKARQAYDKLTWVRLAVFIIAIGLTIYLGGIYWWLGGIFFLLFVAAFYRFILYHEAIKEKANYLVNLQRVNQWGD